MLLFTEHGSGCCPLPACPHREVAGGKEHFISPIPRSPKASPLGIICESQIALCLTSTYICDTNISYYRTNLNNSSNTSTSGVLPEGFTIVERIFSFFNSAIIRCAVCGFNPVSLMKLDVRITGVINSASRT